MSTTPVTTMPTLLVVSQDVMETMLREARRGGAEDVLAMIAAREQYQPTEYMSAEEVAALVGGDLDPKTVYAWAAKGYFTAYHPTARVTRYKRSEVVAFMESGRGR